MSHLQARAAWHLRHPVPWLACIVSLAFGSAAHAGGVCEGPVDWEDWETLTCTSGNESYPYGYPEPTFPSEPATDIDDFKDAIRTMGNFSAGAHSGGNAVRNLRLQLGFPGPEDTPVVALDAVEGAASDMAKQGSPYHGLATKKDWYTQWEALTGKTLPCPSDACSWSAPVTVHATPSSTGFDRNPTSSDNLEHSEQTGIDPVNPATGELVVSEIDLAFPGFGVSYAHRRVYRSRIAYDGPIGYGWDHSYNRRLVEDEESGDVRYQTGEGSTMRFRRAAIAPLLPPSSQYQAYSISYEAPEGVRLRLTGTVVSYYHIGVIGVWVTNRAWELRSPSGVVAKFDGNGLMEELVDANGYGLALTWASSVHSRDSGWALARVRDSVSRVIEYHYDADGRLAAVLEPETQLIASYEYDSLGDLRVAVNSQGRAASYEYDSGYVSSDDDYVPEGFLREGCALACAPSGRSPDAGGACDDAPQHGRSACAQSCLTTALTCQPACKDYCGGGEGLELCRQGCSAGCGAYCSQERVAGLCQAAWKNGGESYCHGCRDRVRALCAYPCGGILYCLGQYDSGEDAEGNIAGNVAECLRRNGLRGFAEGVRDLLATALLGAGDILWCLGSQVCKIPGIPCSSQCNFNWSEEYFTSLCNDVCTECLADGKVDECSPSAANCLAAGVSCRDECKSVFFGYEHDRSDCWESRLSQPSCPSVMTELCGRECRDTCRSRCGRSCVNECQDVCVAGADPAGCADHCAAISDDEWISSCEPSCVEGCLEIERARGPFDGPKYGYLADLNHNLIRIYDGNGQLYLENEYGKDLHEASFDRVVWQNFAGREMTLSYRDLEAEDERERRLADRPAIDQSWTDLVLVDELFDGKPSRWPRPDELSLAYSESLSEFSSVDICPGPCVKPPTVARPEVYVPSASELIAVEVHTDDDSGPEGLAVLAAPKGPAVRPMLLSFRSTQAGLIAESVLRFERDKGPATFSVRVQGHDVSFELMRGGGYLVSTSGTNEPAGEEPAPADFRNPIRNPIREPSPQPDQPPGEVEAILQETGLFVLVDAGGVFRAYLGSPVAVHHVAKGGCHHPFSVTATATHRVLQSGDVCSADLLISPMASRVDDAQLAQQVYEDGAAFHGIDLFAPTRLLPSRHSVSLRKEDGAGTYSVSAGPSEGAPPASLGAAIGRLVLRAPMFLGPSPSSSTASDERPVFAIHAPSYERTLIPWHELGEPRLPRTDGEITIGPPLPVVPRVTDYLVLDTPDKFEMPPMPECVNGFWDAPRRGRGPNAPGSRPSVATVILDGYGVPQTFYYDRQGRTVRTVNHGVASGPIVDSYQYDDLGQLVGIERPLGDRTCGKYDQHGNVTEVVAFARPGGLGDQSVISQRFGYTEWPARLRRVHRPNAPAHKLVEYSYDGKGNLIGTANAAGETTTYTVAAWGLPVESIGPDGAVTRYEYDQAESGQVEQVIIDATGASPVVVSVDYDRAGRPRSATSAMGASRSWLWEGGQLREQSHLSSSGAVTVDYEHDGDGRVIQVSSDRLATTYDYALNGTIQKVVRSPLTGAAAVETSCVEAGPDGRPLQAVLPDGARVRYSYDGAGRLVRVEGGALGASGESWESGCPSLHGDLIPVHAILGETRYDRNGQPIEIVDGAGNLTRVSYDGFGRPAIITNPEGTTVRTGYDSQGLPTWRAVYDASGASVPYRAPSMGDPGLLAAELFGYDLVGRLDTHTAWHFDEQRQPIGSGVAETVVQRDVASREVVIGDAAGQLTRHVYDGAGRLVRTDLPTGDPIELQYLDQGRTVIRRQPAPSVGEQVSRIELTELGQVARTSVVVAGTEVELGAWSHDAYGRVQAVLYPTGQSRELEYDAFGRLAAETTGFGAGAGERVEYGYDAAGRLATRMSLAADVQVTSYRYDALGRMTELTRPEGVAESFSYLGGTGLIERRVDARGVLFDHEYTPAGLLHRVTAGGLERAFQYDGAGRLKHALATGDGPAVTTHFSWDSLGNRIGEQSSLIGPAGAVRHVHDGAGRPIGSRYGTLEVARDFDGLGRLQSLFVGPAQTPTVDLMYEGLGGPAAITRSNGTSSLHEYDWLGRRIEQTELAFDGTELARWRWELPLGSNAPRLSGLRRHGEAEIASVFEIGPGDRLLGENHGRIGLEGLAIDPVASPSLANAAVSGELTPGQAWRSYALDGRHNWTDRDAADPALRGTSIVNGLNAYLTFGATQFQYDQRGAMTAAGDRAFAYDAFGDLVSVETEHGTVSYRYDALGRVVHESGPDGTVVYGYDGPTRAVRKRGSAVDVTLDGDGLDQHLVTISTDGDQHFYHWDRLGSVFLITDEDGQPSEWYEYTAYGEVTILGPDGDLRATSAVGNRFGFQGHPFNPHTGLVEMRARFYDPSIGRFLSPDPIGHLGGPNLYAFVGAAPLSWIDPLGLDRVEYSDHSYRGDLPGRSFSVDEIEYAWWQKPGKWAGDAFVFTVQLAFGGSHANAPTREDSLTYARQSLAEQGALIVATGAGGGLFGGVSRHVVSRTGSHLFGGIAGGAAAGGTVAPALVAIDDIARGEVSDAATYVETTVIGALGGAVFGAALSPFLRSPQRQTAQDATVAVDAAVGAAARGGGKPPGSGPPSAGGRGPGRAPEFHGGQITESGFLRQAENYLGPGYREVSPGRYVSADGLRQVRYGSHEARSSRHHGHFEAYDRPGGRIIENTSVNLIPDP